MRSIKSVYKVGHGPSSSHTVGPYRAAKIYKNKHKDADSYSVCLYGSLACTGEGHSTAKAIKSAIEDITIDIDREEKNLKHPNTMVFKAYKNGKVIDESTIYSIGGGSIRFENNDGDDFVEVYPQKNFTKMLEACKKEGISLPEFIYMSEGNEIKDFLKEIWHAMESEVERGISVEGVLPGGLSITRKAKLLYERRCYNESPDVTMNRMISAYAYACSEENADESLVVTAPTCGSCGVIPAVLYYMRHDKGFPEEEIIDALAVAGLIGNVIRTNASISGAECGCQAEIGSACSMAAGALACLHKLNLDQIEYAAEIAMEHHLGLTCDPVNGLVQIPCIERNAVAAMRAINAVDLSRFLYETRKISFDDVVDTMYKTGKDLSEKYRETAHGGLAALYGDNNK